MAPPSRLEGFREGRGWGRIPPVLLHGGEREAKMDILYKYYSSNFNVLQHIKKPCFKLSHTGTFNDPFESALSEALAENISKDVIMRHYRHRENIIEDINETTHFNLLPDLDYWKEVYKKSPAHYGIVSLTETHRNILMWAHYASSHSGVCIGYKTSLFENNGKDPYYGNINFAPQRVKYDSKRFDLEKYTNNKNTPQMSSIMDSMTTKSNEWIYEKEHRLILPFKFADRVKFFQTPSNRAQKTIEYLLKRNLIHPEKNSFEFRTERKLRLADHYRLNVGLTRIATNNEAMILKDIEVSKIDSIYFGCLSNKQKQLRICKHINNNSDLLGHIKVYRYSINASSFEIDADRIL